MSEKITVKEFSQNLKVSEELIKTKIREVYPNLMKNGKTTFLTKEQAVKIKTELEKTSSILTYTNLAQVNIQGENLIKLSDSVKDLTLEEQIQLSFKLQQSVLENLGSLLKLSEEKRNTLEIELGRNQDYYSVKRVSMLNGKKDKDYNWRLLKNLSRGKGIEINKEFDSNYGNVNSYHIDVWKEIYPNERYN
jgi:hypothetical protein